MKKLILKQTARHTGATVWLFCYCRLLISGRAITRVQLGRVSHFHSVFGQAFSLLSPRPLPAPFDSPHLLLSSGSFNMALSRANCALKENACTAGYIASYTMSHDVHRLGSHCYL